jgi:hypothetical protein
MSIDVTPFLRPLVAALLGVALVTAAVAQPPADRQPGGLLKQADADGDGTVSRDEFVKSRTAMLEERFNKLDANGDGRLDDEEAAAGPRMRPMAEGGEGPRRPDGLRPPRPDGGRPPRAEGDRPQRPGGGAMAGEAFDRLDADGDGKLSREEFVDGMARMREFMQRNGPGPGGPGGPDGPGPGGRGPDQGFRRPPQQD